MGNDRTSVEGIDVADLVEEQINQRSMEFVRPLIGLGKISGLNLQISPQIKETTVVTARRGNDGDRWRKEITIGMDSVGGTGFNRVPSHIDGDPISR
ncbi:hypothetical protein Q3G72_007354 [Acer saccharum]|nr:hypothetical protein Q3G72_007354 [Acer saccharum]